MFNEHGHTRLVITVESERYASANYQLYLDMPSSDDSINVVLYALLDCSALLANALLMFAIVKRTPRVLRSYSALIFNTAVVDSFSALFSLSAVARMNVVDGTLIFTMAGPCTVVGAQFCHRTIFLQAALISQSNILLFIAFCLRLWMLERSSLYNFSQPRIRTVMMLSLCSTAPSILLFIMYDMAASYHDCPAGTVCSALHLWPITAENRLAPLAFGILFSTYSVEFVCVFAVRHALLGRLQKLKAADRARHQMIFNSLTAQMLLPLTSIVGCTAFAVDFLGIVESEWLQRLVILFGSLLALGAPLLNLYFLRPYRKFVIDMIGTGIRPHDVSRAVTASK